MASKTLQVVITGDARGAEGAFKAVEGAAGGAESKLASLAAASKSFGDDAVRLGKSVSLNVSLPILAVGVASVKAASDLEESQSKMQVVFAESAGKIKKWASDSAQSFGLSKAAAYEAVGTFGNLFRAMDVGIPAAAKMSTKLVQLAADLASFNNANPEEVLLALRSGLVGEAEPLRKFGVSLSAARIETEALKMGLAGTKDELTAGMKAQAAYSIIMADTTLAQGDFARTSEGVANRMRILKAELTDAAAQMGVVLLPYVAAGAKAFASLASAIAESPPPVKAAVAGFGALVAVAGPLIWATGKVSQGFGALLNVAESIAGGMQTLAIKALYAVDALKALSVAQLVGMGALGLVLAGTAALIVSLSMGRSRYDDITDASKRWAAVQISNAQAAGTVSQALQALQDKQRMLKAAIEDTAGAQQQAKADYLGQRISLDDYNFSIQDLQLQLAGLKVRHDELSPAIENLKVKVREARIAEEAHKQALLDVASGTVDVTSATDDAVASMQALQSQLLAMSGGRIGYQQSLLNITKAENDLATVLRETPNDWEKVRDAQLRVEQAHLSGVSAALAQDDAITTLKRTIKDDAVYAAMIAKLEESKRLHEENAPAIQAEIDKLVFLKGVVDGLPAAKTVTITLEGILAGADLGGYGVTGAIPRYKAAEGAIINRPTVALIGEAGPEMLVPLGRSPGNSPLPSGGGGGGGPVTLILQVDGRTLGQIMIDDINKAARGGPVFVSSAVA